MSLLKRYIGIGCNDGSSAICVCQKTEKYEVLMLRRSRVTDFDWTHDQLKEVTSPSYIFCSDLMHRWICTGLGISRRDSKVDPKDAIACIDHLLNTDSIEIKEGREILLKELKRWHEISGEQEYSGAAIAIFSAIGHCFAKYHNQSQSVSVPVGAPLWSPQHFSRDRRFPFRGGSNSFR